METVSILPLNSLSAAFQAARVWNDVVGLHRRARETGQKWPGRGELQKYAKGRYALHSQTGQMICHQLLADVEKRLGRTLGLEQRNQARRLRKQGRTAAEVADILRS